MKLKWYYEIWIFNGYLEFELLTGFLNFKGFVEFEFFNDFVDFESINCSNYKMNQSQLINIIPSSSYEYAIAKRWFKLVFFVFLMGI